MSPSVIRFAWWAGTVRGAGACALLSARDRLSDKGLFADANSDPAIPQIAFEHALHKDAAAYGDSPNHPQPPRESDDKNCRASCDRGGEKVSCFRDILTRRKEDDAEQQQLGCIGLCGSPRPQAYGTEGQSGGRLAADAL